MRTMLRFSIPTDPGNRAIRDGTIDKVLRSLMEELKPEAAYFYTRDGRRAGEMIFDMKSSSQIPPLAEQMFLAYSAEVEFVPVMNAEDLQAGLQHAAKYF